MRFETRDIQLASFLVTLGHAVVALEGPANQRTFIFDAVPASVVTAYYAGATQVRPRDLFVNYRNLKRLLHQTA
jgi:hypothetical protein